MRFQVKSFSSFAFVIATMCFSQAVFARPYSLWAKYEANSKNVAKQTTEWQITENAVIPRQTTEYHLKAVELRQARDWPTRVMLDATAQILVDVPKNVADANPQDASHVVSIDEKTSSADILLPENLNSARSVERLALRVRFQFKRDYLCGVERGLLALQTDGGEAKKKQTPKKSGDLKMQTRTFNFLQWNGVPIKVSYCDSLDEKNLVETRPYLEIYAKTYPELVHDTREALVDQYARLSELVGNAVRKRGYADVKMDGSGGNQNFATDEFPFTIVSDVSAPFVLQELDGGDPRTLADNAVFDQDSKLRLALSCVDNCTSGSCDQSNIGWEEFVDKHVTAQLESVDSKGNPDKQDIEPVSMGAGTWALKVDLRDHVNRDAILRLYYYPDSQRLVIREIPIRIKKTGLITSVPLVSEISSLASGKNPKDITFQSSIPVSYAYGFKSPDRLAITLPWLIGFNPRQALGLADAVKLMAHMSILVPTEGSKFDVAFGAGFQFFNSFALAYGKSVGNGGQDFILIGISVPDLVKIANFAR